MDKFAPEAVRSLHKMGFITRTDPTARFATMEDPGRADIMAARQGKVVFIEVKCGRERLEFSQWSARQREWALKYCVSEPFCNPYWLWITLGIDPPNRNPERYRPRHAWLVPYHKFIEAEDQVIPYLDSLPYFAGKGTRKVLQDRQLDAITLLRDWELKWGGNHIWKVPEKHTFFDLYLLERRKETA